MKYEELISKLCKFKKRELAELFIDYILNTRDFDEAEDTYKFIYDKAKSIVKI